MSFQIIQPSALLAPYVRMYWTMESSLMPGEEHFQRIVPSGLAEITFYQHDVPDSPGNKGFLKSQTQLCGQKNCHFDLIVTGKTKLFSILFNPQGISRFFKIPASELFNQTIPLRFILGSRLDEIENKLFEAQTTSEKVSIAEQLLLQLLTEKESYKLPRIAGSVQQINLGNNPGQISKLASDACLSRKQFERTFTELIGISPKQFMRVVRFQRALYIQQKYSGLKLTELAIDAGYYDQSHMISEFKQLSGYTPKQYFSLCEPFSDYFAFL